MINKPPYPKVKFDWEHPENSVCVRCGITKAESDKLPAVATGINHPEYAYTKSFYLGGGNSSDSPVEIMCPRCHRESELESCMKAMDNYAKRHGEEALAKVCGTKVGVALKHKSTKPKSGRKSKRAESSSVSMRGMR